VFGKIPGLHHLEREARCPSREGEVQTHAIVVRGGKRGVFRGVLFRTGGFRGGKIIRNKVECLACLNRSAATCA